MEVSRVALVCIVLCAAVSAQPFLPGTGLLPAGNIATTDGKGPNNGAYNLSLLTTQETGVRAALAFRQDYSDLDILHFLTNVECLEGLFDTYGSFGVGFNGDLEMGGPVPIGAAMAPMDPYYKAHMEEVALNEQGHAAFTRAAGSDIPCPEIDFTGGFNDFMAAAFELPAGETVESVYGQAFNPFQDQQTFILCVLTLEELGATGNLGLSQIALNPVIAGGIGGLATSATAQATVERMLLWQLRNETINPFNETAQQVFARVSALRDSLDGPQFDDQGLVNTDARTIAVPLTGVNMVPTDNYGLTFTRTPAQIINILTLGSANGTGVFFPSGLNGAINTPAGYESMASGTSTVAANTPVASQEPADELGSINQPITASGPASVPNQDGLTQWLGGTAATPSYTSRGYDLTAPASGPVNIQPASFQFQMGVNSAPTATGGK